MVNKSAKALKEYANNTCTALVDKDHWVNRLQLTDEHQEHVKQLMELSPGACNYCGNPAPLHHYIACEDHVACENCAEHNETICSRREPTKCKLCSKHVHFPLPKCNFFSKIEQGIADVLQQQEHAFQMEFNRRNQDEPVAQIWKVIRTCDKCAQLPYVCRTYRPKRYVRSTLNVSKRPSLELKTSMRTAYEVSSVIHTRESIVIDRKFRYVTDVTDVTNG